MLRRYDNGGHSVYRVNVVCGSHSTRTGTYARVNVKASSPTAAREWVLSYPGACGIHQVMTMEVTHSYKLRKQPVWLKKLGTYSYRFDVLQLVTWKYGN